MEKGSLPIPQDKIPSEEEAVKEAYDDVDDVETQKFADLNETEGEVKILNQEGQEAKDYGISYISDTTWETLGVKKELVENLVSKGFKTPSKIQANVFQVFKSQPHDIIGQSQNGSGKTLSFLVPCISVVDEQVVNTHRSISPQVIILADTKELTYQIYKIASLIKLDWQVVDFMHQDKNNFDDVNVHVLVTTMGSLFFMIKKKRLNLSNLKLLVIDEADKMVLSDSNKSKFPSLFKAINKEARIGLFSATLPEKCVEILDSLKREYTQIVVESKTDLNLKNLNHYWVRLSRREKLDFIDKFMKELSTGSVIIFVNSKKFADAFARKLYKRNHKTEILLGDMKIKDRIDILNKFKQGQIRILISTNLISRGIDARKVSLVINLDMPYTYKRNLKRGQDPKDSIDAETYLHRTGRTARFGDKGIALNIIEDQRGEDDIAVLEEKYGIKMTQITKDNFEEIVKLNDQVLDFNKQKREANEELI